MYETIAPGKPPGRVSGVAATGLLDWLEAPRADHGLRFAQDDGSWTFLEYPRLASLVAQAAERILAERSRTSGAVSIAIPSGPEFVAAFFGTLLAGHTPSPLALPIFLRDPELYVRHVAAILQAADPALVLVDPSFAEQLAQASHLAGLAHRPVPLEMTDASVAPRRRPPAELALLQFTSGSSGAPRGVRVSWENLECNLAMIAQWVRMEPEDAGATWLPLNHDMGLIGTLLFPMIRQIDTWVLRPDQFVRDPLRWLELYGRHGMTMAVAPNFGFAYIHRRVSDEDLEGMDFSRWKLAMVAAERLDPEILTRFARRLEPFGFKASAYVPAYGLAEGTLAVTGVPRGEVPRAVRPRWAQMELGKRVPIEASARLGEPDRFGSGAGWLVSCGRPLAGVSVSVVDEDGSEIPESHLGEIKVDAPSVARGYTSAGDGCTRFTPDGLRTGDAGLMLDGELFVLGRIGDSIKVRGRTVFVEDVEARLAAIDGISRGKVVVLAGADGQRNVLVAVVEAPPGMWAQEASRILEAEAAGEAAIEIVASPPRAIQRTSSGKPRRRLMWRDFLSGSLPGETVFAKCDRGAPERRHPPLLSRGIAAPEVEAFRSRVRGDIERDISGHVAEAERRRRFPRAAVEALGRAGLLRERWDGGDHGDAGKAVLIAEELGRAACGGVGVGIGVHIEAVLSILRRFGQSDALGRLRERALDGHDIGCIAASERAHGSNIAAVETVAFREGDCWRIQGEKRYVSLGATADFALVLARERDLPTGSPAPALTMFAVPAAQLRVTERLRSLGNRSLETVTLQIDASVPDELVLSRPGRGMHVVTWGLTHERLASAAQALGGALLAIDLATSHARRRLQFGSHLIGHQAVRVRLAQLASQVWLARAGVYALAGSLSEARPDTARHVAGAKVTAARMAERVLSDCMQVLGGHGYLEDASPFARLWRDVRLARIGGGTDEMMWELVAGGLRGDDELYDRFVRPSS
jgi:alkylation response protein AidB-like acyl-CoA dehydrogenase/acyl-CoA synthetase (AMP-forming)/AMP-acid ligase II